MYADIIIDITQKCRQSVSTYYSATTEGEN